MSTTRPVKALPSTIIPKAKVNARIKHFRDTKLPLLSNAIGKSDSTSGWYSLEQFEELMREMYYLNADGLRIYFGAHEPNDPDYPNQLTVIFVPTYHNKATGSHADIVHDDEVNFQVRLSETASQVELADINKGIDSIGLCPPTCDEQEFSYPY